MITATAVMMYGSAIDSPFIVPVAMAAMVLGIVAVCVYAAVRGREMRSHERLAAIAKGLPLPPTESELALIHGRPSLDMTRRRSNSRLAGNLLVFSGIGIIAFFIVLAAVLQVRPVLCGAAVGLVPLFLGMGFHYDVRKQNDEIAALARERAI